LGHAISSARDFIFFFSRKRRRTARYYIKEEGQLQKKTKEAPMAATPGWSPAGSWRDGKARGCRSARHLHKKRRVERLRCDLWKDQDSDIPC
ncbi:hypothetical protein ACJX0J_016347, partial [Zea mays]